MEWTVLLAVIAFKKANYEIIHYPMQVKPWIEQIQYNPKDKGKVSITIKDSVFSAVPNCRWSPLDSNSTAVGTITYFSKESIGLSFFGKDSRKKKDGPQDISFILSCRAPKET